MIMKHTIIIFMVAVSLVSCGNNNTKEKTVTADTTINAVDNTRVKVDSSVKGGPITTADSIQANIPIDTSTAARKKDSLHKKKKTIKTVLDSTRK